MGRLQAEFDAGQRALLESMARGEPLRPILEGIVRLIEAQGNGDGMRCTLLLVEDRQLRARRGASPSLPAAYTERLEGLPIGPEEGSCGAAAALGERVIVEDIATHPNWAKYKDLALPFGLRACWSSPIFSAEREVLGTFAIYYPEPKRPTDTELGWVDAATHLASIAIARDRADAERRQLMETLRQSEERLRAVIELTPDVAIQWYDAEGRILFCNRTSERLFGWRPGAAIGKTLFELGFFDAAQEEFFAECRRKAARDAPVDPTEFVYRRPDGSVGYLLSTVFQIPLSATSHCCVCMDVDLTEWRRTKMAAQESDAMRAIAFASVQDAIFYLGVEPRDSYRFLSVNAAFCLLTGHSEKDVVGRLVNDVVPEPSLSLVLEKYKRAIMTRLSVSWEEVTPYPTGLKYGEVTVSPVIDARSGQILQLVGTVHDMTAHRLAEEERRRLERKLQQAQRLQSLGSLASGIAHDFNNVLASVHANAELTLMQLGDGHPCRAPVIDVIGAARRAGDLVRRILSFSRDHAPKLVPVDPAPVVAEALKLLHVTVPSSLELRTTLPDGLPHVVLDAVQMHQIVMNLVANAVHAMRNRKGAIEVALAHRIVRAEDELRRCPDLQGGAEYVVLTVGDGGVGMDAATMQRVFDPFFTTKPDGEGTGLGLSTVHDIVRAHSGAITVDSVIDAGTTFTLYFPVTPPARSKREPSIGPGRGQRILFVDDEEPLVYLAKRTLDRLGYQVTGHSNPRAALDDFRARAMQFDVVVTDVSMPTLGGHELAEAILDIRRDVLVVLLTGAIRPEDRAAADRLHVRHVLHKPLTTEELARALDPILNSVRPQIGDAGTSLAPPSSRSR